MRPIRGIPLGQSDPLRAHSAAGAAGWQLLDGDLPVGSPPNAVGHYGRGARRALLCRDRAGGRFFLGEYAGE